MLRKISCTALAVLLCGLMTTASFGQPLTDGLYEFDSGGDGTSWNDAMNWNVVLNPDGTTNTGGDPASPPDVFTTADIPSAGVVSSSAGNTARNVNVGTAAGAGSLSISSGDLTLVDMRVGADASGVNGGSLDISGGTLDVAASGGDIEIGVTSAGTMTMSGGVANAADDFVIRTGSSLTMTGGSINIGDRLVTEDDATLTLDGGEIIADDDFFFFDSSQVTVNSGLLEVADKLRIDDAGGKVTINGGIVRSNEFGQEDGTTGEILLDGLVEINGSGLLQVELGVDDGVPGDGTPLSQLSLATANQLIAEGMHLTTSDSGKTLFAEIVTVPDFFGDTDVSFVQISVVPEPTSLLLLSLGAMALAVGRKRA